MDRRDGPIAPSERAVPRIAPVSDQIKYASTKILHGATLRATAANDDVYFPRLEPRSSGRHECDLLPITSQVLPSLMPT